CESRVIEAKEADSRKKVDAAELKKGRDLYLDAKSEADGYITFLQAGAATRFQGKDDAAKVERLLGGRCNEGERGHGLIEPGTSAAGGRGGPAGKVAGAAPPLSEADPRGGREED